MLYSFSLMFLFLSSTLFHSFFMMPQSKRSALLIAVSCSCFYLFSFLLSLSHYLSYSSLTDHDHHHLHPLFDPSIALFLHCISHILHNGNEEIEEEEHTFIIVFLNISSIISITVSLTKCSLAFFCLKSCSVTCS